MSSEPGSGFSTTTLDGANHVVAIQGVVTPGHEEVRVSTLDDDLDPALAVAFIKVDAEGLDEAILRGAKRVLVDYRPVVMVETWDGGAEIRSFFGALGYECYVFDSRRNELDALPADWAKQANLFAIHERELEHVRERIRDMREWSTTGVSVPDVNWRARKA